MDQHSREIYKAVFRDENSFATTLVMILIDQLGTVEWFDWDPDAIRAEIQTRFESDLPQDNMDKLMALVICLTTERFYVDIDFFIHACNAMGGEGSNFKTFDPAEIDEMSWTITEVALNDPLEKPREELFAPDIQEYIRREAVMEGYGILPSPLKFVGEPKELFSELEESAEFGEDFFASSWQAQQQQAKNIEDMVKRNMELLVKQIQSIPLIHGDSESWQKFAGKPLTVKSRGL